MMKNDFKLSVKIFIFSALVFFSCGDGNRDSVGDFGSGRGGSMARFTVSGQHLYVVDNRKLITFDVNQPLNPVKTHELALGFDIETIFPFESYLLIGAQTGMHIVSISEPSSPEYISSYSHLASCDPVVARGNHAYVTLRMAAGCWGVNELHVLDISNVQNPTNLNVIQMLNPHGLAIGQNNMLFVCEGEYGMKVFDISDPVNPVQTHHFEGFHAYDVIAHRNILIMTGNNGISQFEYTSDTIRKISEIAVFNEN